MLGQSSTTPKRNLEETSHEQLEQNGESRSDKCLYDAERQGIVNVSLHKLQGSADHLKPSLRRFVLISNTLRHIKCELSSEGRMFDSERLGAIIATKLVPDESPFLEFFGSTEVGRMCKNNICKLERGSFSDYVREPRVPKADLKYAQVNVGWNKAVEGENHDRIPASSCALATVSSSSIDAIMSAYSSISSFNNLHTPPATCGLHDALKPTLTTSQILEQTPQSLDIPDLDVDTFGDVDMSQYDYDGSDWLLPFNNSNPKSPTQETVEEWLIKLQAENNCISNFSSDAAPAGEVIC